jgi:hypothetical protein
LLKIVSANRADLEMNIDACLKLWNVNGEKVIYSAINLWIFILISTIEDHLNN